VDILVLLVIGAIGFLMRRFGLPVLPAILGVILGPDAELQLRRSLQIADGDVSTLFSTPLAIGVYTVIALLLLFPLIRRALPTRPAAARPGSDEATTKDDELV
jgi:putative tricarboxylic transport membrane protein